jgi:hypothetical protein
VGNSLTFVNELPDLLTQLVASDPANRPLFAVRFVPGGYPLAQDVDDHQLSGLIHEASWDFVVLQENSNYSLLEGSYRDAYTVAPARALATTIRSISAEPLLFVTWGYRSGYPSIPGDTYQSMQDRVDATYRDVAGELLYHRDPSSTYKAGLGRADAVFLQHVALSVVDEFPPLR